MGGKSDTPATPDYVGLAKQQTEANKAAALQTAALNRVNTSDSFGTTTWQLRAGADPNNPQAGDYTQVTTLSPEQQALLQQKNTNQQTSANLANSTLALNAGLLGTPVDTSQAPAQVSSNFTTDPSQFLDDRQKASDAVYAGLTRYQNPIWEQNQQALDASLANQGLQRGSKAWDDAQNNFQDQKTQAYQQMADTAYEKGAGVQAQDIANLNSSVAGQQTARANALQEQTGLKNDAVNRYNALMGGVTTSLPTATNVNATSAGYNTSDLLNAAMQAYQGQVSTSNAENAGAASTTSAGIGAVAAIAVAI